MPANIVTYIFTYFRKGWSFFQLNLEKDSRATRAAAIQPSLVSVIMDLFGGFGSGLGGGGGGPSAQLSAPTMNGAQ